MPSAAVHRTRRRPLPGVSRVGVFDGLALHVDGESGEVATPETLLEVWGLAKAFDLGQLWLTLDGAEACGLPRKYERGKSHRFLTSGTLVVPHGQTTLVPWLSAWSNGSDGHMVEVAIPGWESGPWSATDFGPALAGELYEFMLATGMTWKRSGAITSDAWLRQHHAHTGLLEATEQPDIAHDGNLEPDLHWTRWPSRAEGRSKFCYAYDANAMYLGAASSLPLPVGEMRHWELPTELAVDHNHPGYWRHLDAWLTTPTAAYEENGTLANEVYYWPKTHRLLEPWYKVLRDARTHLLTYGPSAALEAVKAVYRQGIGRLGSTNRTIDNDPLYQPYWRHAVQAEARCRLLRRVDNLRNAEPVAIDVDCLYFLTSYGDPLRFAKSIKLPIGDGIGQFKFAGALEAKRAREIIGDKDEAGVDALGELREELH